MKWTCEVFDTRTVYTKGTLEIIYLHSTGRYLAYGLTCSTLTEAKKFIENRTEDRMVAQITKRMKGR